MSTVAATAAPEAAAPADQVAGARRKRPSAVLVAMCLLITGLLLLPLAFLVLQATQVGWSQLSQVLFRQLTGQLLTNTVELAVIVTAASSVIAVAAAWCVERTNLPLRRLWAALVVVPVAIPDFVTAYTWHSIAPTMIGLRGAAMVMTLTLYPLIYLPVAASLRRADPAVEEAARSLGNGPVRVFLRVTLRQIRPALLGGCLVVMLALLAEYGAFEILRFQTFTTEIFTEINNFQLGTACALSLVLVLLGVLVLAGEAAASGGGRISRSGLGANRPPTRHRLRWGAAPVLLGFAALVGTGLGVPIGTLVYWMNQHNGTVLPAASTLGDAAAHTVGYALAAAALATVLALPVALLTVRHRNRSTMVLQRSTMMVQALPGLVIALSLVFFSVHYAISLYQSPQLLVLAYAVLFFPLALISVRTSVMQAPPHLEEIARSLGSRPLGALLRVTLPLIGPGLAASFCLVFLSTVTELTATLVLIPTGAQTLATQFWAFQQNTSYSAAAPYAAVIVAIAVVPSYLLGRWFDRRSQGGTP